VLDTPISEYAICYGPDLSMQQARRRKLLSPCWASSALVVTEHLQPSGEDCKLIVVRSESVHFAVDVGGQCTIDVDDNMPGAGKLHSPRLLKMSAPEKQGNHPQDAASTDPSKPSG
jgi:hypothetical protein